MPLWILLGVAAVCVLALGGYAGYKSLVGNLFQKRIDAALAQGHYFSPPGECVADILATERAKYPNSPEIAQADQKVRSKLEPLAAESLQRWYKDSDPSVDWDKLEKEYALLQSLFPNDDEIAADDAYARAQEAILSGNYEQARQFYQEALNKKPNWALALNGLGKIYMRTDSPLRDEQRAVGLYEQAIQADPKFTWAYVNLGIYYRLQHDLVTAKAYMSRALATDPDKASLLALMGAICAEGREYQESLQYYEKALSSETDASKQEKLRATIVHLQQILAETGAGPQEAPGTSPQASSEIGSVPGSDEESSATKDSDQPRQPALAPSAERVVHPEQDLTKEADAVIPVPPSPNSQAPSTPLSQQGQQQLGELTASEERKAPEDVVKYLFEADGQYIQSVTLSVDGIKVTSLDGPGQGAPDSIFGGFPQGPPAKRKGLRPLRFEIPLTPGVHSFYLYVSTIYGGALSDNWKCIIPSEGHKLTSYETSVTLERGAFGLETKKIK
jgi:tetratricopeptide (TPR) repeat protein